MRNGAWEQLPGHALETFALRLSSGEVDLLRRYVEELIAWAPRMNLLSRSDLDRVVGRHLLDSLSLVWFARGCNEVADFGSGAGFPGIPVCVLAPRTRVHLVEPRRKRCTFLRHVTRSLGLSNVRVWEERGELWAPAGAMDAVMSRGLRAELLAELASRVLSPTGKLLVMSKRGASRPLPGGFVESAKLEYRLPGGEEHEVAVHVRSHA